MDMPKIESGIAIPNAWGYGWSAALRKLEAGQSVVLPAKPHSARNLAAKALGVGNYAARKVEGGIRIWRLK